MCSIDEVLVSLEALRAATESKTSKLGVVTTNVRSGGTQVDGWYEWNFYISDSEVLTSAAIQLHESAPPVYKVEVRVCTNDKLYYYQKEGTNFEDAVIDYFSVLSEAYDDVREAL